MSSGDSCKKNNEININLLVNYQFNRLRIISPLVWNGRPAGAAISKQLYFWAVETACHDSSTAVNLTVQICQSWRWIIRDCDKYIQIKQWPNLVSDNIWWPSQKPSLSCVEFWDDPPCNLWGFMSSEFYHGWRFNQLALSLGASEVAVVLLSRGKQIT